MKNNTSTKDQSQSIDSATQEVLKDGTPTMQDIEDVEAPDSFAEATTASLPDDALGGTLTEEEINEIEKKNRK